MPLILLPWCNRDRNRDFDFLSSIEILIIDQAHHLLMQNWDHLLHVLDHANLIPTKDHGCDFGRIKEWYIDGLSKNFRQTIALSDFRFPELTYLFNSHFNNVEGKLLIKRDKYEGTINDVIPQVKQVFDRILCDSLLTEPGARFQWFTQKVLPSLSNRKSVVSTAVYIPDYFDYVRIRNFMDDNDYEFEAICEYSSSSDIARSRTLFFQNRTPILLYTERVHFFHRYKLRGMTHLFFYALPSHAGYYPELANFLTLPHFGGEVKSEEELKISALFSRYDKLKLERIVGTHRVKKMLTEPKGTFMFV